ncbi:phage portal protein [Rubellicoccus peritrichatus]|uniref:Phage portal protein n=1 Tax=Rubellicoccus peritrichatus TaxID=3080537 RepID=A0AAQ3LG17_9BACT|nr:phage portal protein [Puniceicoccus sp. CR14]WOO43153.1 phage portal protein [Puniceicoccus sp. CR14]
MIRALRTAATKGFGSLYYWMGGGKLYAKPSNERSIERLTADHKDLLSELDHEDIVSATRFLYNRFPMLSGAIDDKANHVVGNGWGAQFEGTDLTWGEQSEAWLKDHFQICDVRGRPFDMKNDLHTGVVTLMRDGEYFIVLTKNKAGYPMFQFLESHRIRCRKFTPEYRGLQVRNGIAYSAQGRPLFYHFFGDSSADDRWISARDIIHVFDPKWFSQGRGVSPLVTGILDWLDVLDVRENEKYAQRLFSMLALKHKNESGKPDSFAQRFGKSGNTRTATSSDADNDFEAEELVQEFRKGQIRWLKIGSEDVESFLSNRPTSNQQAFEQAILRGAFAGINWSYEQSYDGGKLSGAPVRRDIAKNQRSVERMQCILFYPWFRQVGFSVSVAIELGFLTAHSEWFRFTPQLPAKMTVDAGNESKIELEEYRIGFSTLKKITGSKGDWWQEVRQQREIEADDLLTRGKRLAENHEIPLAAAISLLEMRTSSGNPGMVEPQPEQEEEPENEDEEAEKEEQAA